MKIYDISPLISEEISVWPGDTPFSRENLLQISKGANIDLSTIRTTVHLGAHVDAPSHYGAPAASIDEVELTPYFGRAQVIEVTTRAGDRIYPQDLTTSVTEPRVLLKTNSFANPNQFTTDFSSLSPELVDFLHQKSVVLVGIDTPSVDPFADKILESHQALLKHKMRNIEGIILKDVPAGSYNFMALPLKIKGADASPVRAILYNELKE